MNMDYDKYIIKKLIEVRDYLEEFVNYFPYLTIVIMIHLSIMFLGIHISSHTLFILMIIGMVLDLKISKSF